MRIPWESKWSNMRESRKLDSRELLEKSILTGAMIIFRSTLFFFFFILFHRYKTRILFKFVFNYCVSSDVKKYCSPFKFIKSLLLSFYGDCLSHFGLEIELLHFENFCYSEIADQRNEELKNVSECSITELLGYEILEHECTCSYGNWMAQRPISLFPFSRSLSIRYLSGDFNVKRIECQTLIIRNETISTLRLSVTVIERSIKHVRNEICRAIIRWWTELKYLIKIVITRILSLLRGLIIEKFM